MKKIEYIVMLHDLEKNNSLRIDFDSKKKPNNVIKGLRLKNYKLCQFIQNEYLVEISENELTEKKIRFDILPRTKRTWFGLSKKEVNDILIVQTNEFMYPYIYGHFVYYFSKHEIGKPEMQSWLSEITPNLFGGLDDIYSAMNNYSTKLINNDDYVIVTNHDHQNQFGISAISNILELIRVNIEGLEVDHIEYDEYNQTQK